MTATATDFRPLSGAYTVDAAHSRFGFVARSALVTKVRGVFDEFEATAVIDGEDPARSSVVVVLRTASVDTRNERRDGHLRTRFLDAGKHPVISFRSTSIAHEGGDGFVVTGELTMKGVTRSISIPLEFQGAARDPFGNDRIGFAGSVVINRRDWGVTWKAALDAGGVFVGDQVTLEFEISAIRRE